MLLLHSSSIYFKKRELHFANAEETPLLGAMYPYTGARI